MFLKKLPHEVVGRDLPCAFSQESQARVPAGPGMTTSLDGVEDHFRAFLAGTIPLPPRACTVVLEILQIGDHWRFRAAVRLYPDPDRLVDREELQVLGDSLIRAAEEHQPILGPVEVEYRHGSFRLAVLDRHGPGNRGDGGNPVRELGGEAV